LNLQYNHDTAQFKVHSFPITIVCDNLQSPANLGSLFRLCDAFGVKNVVLCGSQTDLDRPRLRKAARNADASLVISKWETTEGFIMQLESDQHLSIALEYSTKSISLTSFDLKSELPILLFIGNENNGVSQQVLDFVNHTLHIDMYGVNSSMNVIQATGIALYEITQKLLGQR